MFRAAAIVCAFVLVCITAAFAQPPLTSDSTKARLLPQPNPGIYPGRAAVYVPPQIDVFPALVTNTRPLVVEITIVSNVVQRTIWHSPGQVHTNELVLSSNFVSRATNVVQEAR